jgi:hypothetical protein
MRRATQGVIVAWLLMAAGALVANLSAEPMRLTGFVAWGLGVSIMVVASARLFSLSRAASVPDAMEQERPASTSI